MFVQFASFAFVGQPIRFNICDSFNYGDLFPNIEPFRQSQPHAAKIGQSHTKCGLLPGLNQQAASIFTPTHDAINEIHIISLRFGYKND